MKKPTKEFQSLDDILKYTYESIIEEGQLINSKRGGNFEILGYSATLKNPRARTSMSLDRKLVKSKFAEFAWYLSKDEDKNYITPYIKSYNKESEENNKILGAYGSKIFGQKDSKKSQFERVIEQIDNRPLTKQAYLSISDSKDYKYRDGIFSSPPCTIGLHFIVRNEKLNLITYMRSNDAYFGLPHDLFCFTMLQELVANRTNLELGTYTHTVSSMHIYEPHIKHVKDYIDEGLQDPIEMPKIKDASYETLNLVSEEFDLRIATTNLEKLDDYWSDYVKFSKKHSPKKTDKKKWVKSFKNKNMKYIAENSIAK